MTHLRWVAIRKTEGGYFPDHSSKSITREGAEAKVAQSAVESPEWHNNNPVTRYQQVDMRGA